MFNKQNKLFGKDADFASFTLMKPPSSHCVLYSGYEWMVAKKNGTQ